MLGLFGGLSCQVVIMMFWNYLIAPIYMGYPREEVTALLLPAFLPFNLIKGGLNAAITMLLYKPLVSALRRSGLVEAEHLSEKRKINAGVMLAALFIIITCVFFILSFHGII